MIYVWIIFKEPGLYFSEFIIDTAELDEGKEKKVFSHLGQIYCKL